MLNRIAEFIDSPDPFSPKLEEKVVPSQHSQSIKKLLLVCFQIQQSSVYWFTVLLSQSNL